MDTRESTATVEGYISFQLQVYTFLFYRQEDKLTANAQNVFLPGRWKPY